MTKEQEDQGFRVTDKRGFREDGDARTPEDAAKTEEKSAGSQPSSDQTSSQELPPRTPIDFSSYVISYYTNGCVLLGEVPNPYTKKKEEDLEGAQYIIDLLSMLEEKTKGNLSNEEKKLLEDVLYELRMRFMAKTNRIKY